MILDDTSSGGDDTIATIGHNSSPKPAGIAVDRLRNLVDRIERMEEEQKALASDKRDIYLEAKSAGLDVKVLRQLITLRRKQAEEVRTQEALLDTYRHALGM